MKSPLLIIAGAGSGKTLTVASKIAYLLEQGAKTEIILALAFNEKAVEELSNTEIVDIERWFETSIGEVKLRGRIDRIYKDGSGYIVVSSHPIVVCYLHFSIGFSQLEQ